MGEMYKYSASKVLERALTLSDHFSTLVTKQNVGQWRAEHRAGQQSLCLVLYTRAPGASA